MVKGSPTRIWDVVGFLRDGGVISGWGLVPSYRAWLMQPGHRCFLWVSGARPGIWATGEVTAAPVERTGGDDPYWLDNSKRHLVRPYVGLRLVGLDEPLSKDLLARDPRFAMAEVLRAPRMGNPLVLTADEVAVIDAEL